MAQTLPDQVVERNWVHRTTADKQNTTDWTLLDTYFGRRYVQYEVNGRIFKKIFPKRSLPQTDPLFVILKALRIAFQLHQTVWNPWKAFQFQLILC